MKFQLMLLSLSAAAALPSMSPALEERELTWNDVPACKNGGHLPDDVYKYGKSCQQPTWSTRGAIKEADRFTFTADDCRQKCFGREEAGGDNKYGVCAGYCRTAAVLGSFKCFGKSRHMASCGTSGSC